ncbi:type II toxin-antitoxin system RelE/ParE family toxin [Agrobacterium tumefaciens]|uniref:type II toxin-antitoxin system RelE/ParE family toxin n=1 Tax=Agrobacterium tumefaciens TaxID=358 RepID=UPI00385105D7
MKSLGTAPFQGTLLPNGLPGIRRVTKHQAILYLDVDEPKEMVRILAVFFGGQGHQRHMLKRLAARPPDA